MEAFMVYTGFYDVATRKEAERRLERKMELESKMHEIGESKKD